MLAEDLDSGMHSSLTMEECGAIANIISSNDDSEFVYEELQYIALMDVEGARVYLDDKTQELREEIFESLVERESKTFRYQGRFASQMFVPVDEGTEGGFWSGKVITEYDLNLSMRFYYLDPDVNDAFDSIIIYGSACVMAMLAADLTVLAVTNLQAIKYYCKSWGIREGLDFYRTLGTQYVPNGILSQIQFYENTRKGTLTGSLDGLKQPERRMVEDLLNQGKNVEIIPRSDLPGVKTPDFRVDGILTELKSLNGTSLNTPVTRIQEGFKQGAQTVIIDGRSSGLTADQANTVIIRINGVYNNSVPGKIEIWTIEGVIYGGK